MSGVLLALVLLGGCALGFANGANDNAKGVATLIGAGRLTARSAILYGTATTLLGSAAAVAAALALPALACAQKLPDPGTLQGDPVVTVLPPDAIPAIDDPELVPADQVRFLQDDEPVLGVVHEGVAKAYSLWHLDRHEIVNDRLGDTPITATW